MHAADGGKDIAGRAAELCGVALVDPSTGEIWEVKRVSVSVSAAIRQFSAYLRGTPNEKKSKLKNILLVTMIGFPLVLSSVRDTLLYMELLKMASSCTIILT